MFCGKKADSHERSVSSDVKVPPASVAYGSSRTYVRSPFPGNAAQLVKHILTASAAFSLEKRPVIPTRRFHMKATLTFRAAEFQFSSRESHNRPEFGNLEIPPGLTGGTSKTKAFFFFSIIEK